jgi:hypothetical protein
MAIDQHGQVTTINQAGPAGEFIARLNTGNNMFFIRIPMAFDMQALMVL